MHSYNGPDRERLSVCDRVGIVLAGGFATRFGDRDKTLVAVDGRPLIGHAVDGLAPAVDTVVVSCRSDQVERFEEVLGGVTYRPDPEPDEGPLAGLATALGGLDAERVAVATADRPSVPPGLYRSLFDALAADGVVIRASDVLQPAPAVFDTTSLRGAVERQRDAGNQRLRSVFETLDLAVVPAETVYRQWGEDVLLDVNTEADLDGFRTGR